MGSQLSSWSHSPTMVPIAMVLLKDMHTSVDMRVCMRACAHTHTRTERERKRGGVYILLRDLQSVEKLSV